MGRTRPLRVGIIGGGPRGLSVLDRCLCVSRSSGERVEVTIVEPHALGMGAHRADQPDYLMLNTVAGQATALADSAMVEGAPTSGAPPFLTWCLERGLEPPRLPGDTAEGLSHADFMPRRVFGEYLAWTAEWLLARVPGTATVRRICDIAVGLDSVGNEVTVKLAAGDEFVADLLFITTGHGLVGDDEDPRYVPRAYPLPSSVDHIGDDQSVALSGMGLAAIDVVAALTEGRGGRFVAGTSGREYVPSGHEPSILLFSRGGWLPAARPANPRRSPHLGGSILTFEALDTARGRTVDGRLDFDSDVLPLILAEVLDPELDPMARRVAERLVAPPVERFANSGAYAQAVMEQAAWDIREARLGLGVSLYKEHMERLRDHREVLRRAVAPPGLTDQGHRSFFRQVPSMANRAAVGPQIDRLVELLAVARSGVVSFSVGPAPTIDRLPDGWRLQSTRLDTPEEAFTDVLVVAHLDRHPAGTHGVDPMGDALSVVGQLHPADERYLHLDPEGRLYARDGSILDHIVVLGPPAEGANYYNNYVLWPGVRSGLLIGVDNILRQSLGC